MEVPVIGMGPVSPLLDERVSSWAKLGSVHSHMHKTPHTSLRTWRSFNDSLDMAEEIRRIRFELRDGLFAGFDFESERREVFAFVFERHFEIGEPRRELVNRRSKLTPLRIDGFLVVGKVGIDTEFALVLGECNALVEVDEVG